MSDRDEAWRRFGRNADNGFAAVKEARITLPIGYGHEIIPIRYILLMARAAIVFAHQGFAPVGTTIFDEIMSIDHEIPGQGVVYSVDDSLAGLALAEVFSLVRRGAIRGLTKYSGDEHAIFGQNPDVWNEERQQRGYLTVQASNHSGRMLRGHMGVTEYIEGMLHGQIFELVALDPAAYPQQPQQPRLDYSI